MRIKIRVRIFVEASKLKKRGRFCLNVTSENRRGKGFGFAIRGEIFGNLSIGKRRWDGVRDRLKRV